MHISLDRSLSRNRSRSKRFLLGFAIVAASVAAGTSGHATPVKFSSATKQLFEFKGSRSYKSFRAELKASMSAAEWNAFKSEPLGLHDMRQDAFGGEDKEGFERKGTVRPRVDYFRNDKERAPFELSIKDGKYFQGGKPYDTKGRLVVAVAAPADGKPDSKGPHKMYAENGKTDHLNVKHSSFMAGNPAFFAPEKRVTNGVPEFMTNRSGHYRMTRRSFVRYLLHLETLGLDMSKLEIQFDKKSAVD